MTSEFKIGCRLFGFDHTGIDSKHLGTFDAEGNATVLPDPFAVKVKDRVHVIIHSQLFYCSVAKVDFVPGKPERSFLRKISNSSFELHRNNYMFLLEKIYSNNSLKRRIYHVSTSFGL